jgi:hypothetical protein
MKAMVLAAATAAAGFVAALTATPAEARDGCGRGFHRGYHGQCISNRYYRAGGPARLGYYYEGRGWYDGRRYYHQRYRYRNGWRYR